MRALLLFLGACASEAIETEHRAAVTAAATTAAVAPPALATAVAAPPCPADMVLVPGGSFKPKKRRRRVQQQAVCLDRTEVTVAAYAACVRAGSCTPSCPPFCGRVPDRAAWRDPSENARASHFCNGERPERLEHPVNCVSLEESRQYCAAQEKRLPTAAEWQLAARGEEGRLYPWGGGELGEQPCWSRVKVKDGTCPAGGMIGDATPAGVLDLAGNLSEWVESSGSAQVFGASWYAIDDGYVAAALGGVEAASSRNETYGFRCAADPR